METLLNEDCQLINRGSRDFPCDLGFICARNASGSETEKVRHFCFIYY